MRGLQTQACWLAPHQDITLTVIIIVIIIIIVVIIIIIIIIIELKHLLTLTNLEKEN